MRRAAARGDADLGASTFMGLIHYPNVRNGMFSNFASAFFRVIQFARRAIRGDVVEDNVLCLCASAFLRRILRFARLLIVQASRSQGTVSNHFKCVVSTHARAATRVNRLAVAVSKKGRARAVCCRTVHLARVLFHDLNMTCGEAYRFNFGLPRVIFLSLVKHRRWFRFKVHVRVEGGRVLVQYP